MTERQSPLCFSLNYNCVRAAQTDLKAHYNTPVIEGAGLSICSLKAKSFGTQKKEEAPWRCLALWQPAVHFS